MIIDEIKKANVEAIKSRDSVARAALSVLMNKYMLANIEKKAKSEVLSDEDLINIIQKFSKELTEEAENYKKISNIAEFNAIMTQKATIEKYLPIMMTAEEIKAVIIGLTDKSVPAVMKYFKQNYNGKCEMRLVSDVLKTL
ncbi:MAG: GatB/YqeY domain-containing protein [Clostridia bacterium]|nr:GatB/YqeY domain-containing protein [Clostridia bacterium]